MIQKWENGKPTAEKVIQVVFLRGKVGCKENRGWGKMG